MLRTGTSTRASSTEVHMAQNIPSQAGIVGTPEIIDPDPTQAEDYEVGLKSHNQWQLAWRKFRKHRLALIGLGIISALFVIAIVGPVVIPLSFTEMPQPSHVVQVGRAPCCTVGNAGPR